MFRRSISWIALAALVVLPGCDPDRSPTGPDLRGDVARGDAPPGLQTVPTSHGSVALWPYLNDNLSSTPLDPVNLIFTGLADPRDIRAALLSLNGDRTALGFPPVPPFDCVWSDAIGGLMMGYGPATGWVGGAVQLQCGGFGPIRFHLRLFDLGTTTVANVHFEVLIPGTTDHQVLSWELAEQLVIADFARSGLLAGAPQPSGTINQAPFRTIPSIIYNGLPAALQQLLGGPAAPVVADVPIATDGRATILDLGHRVTAAPGRTSQRFVVNFDQTVPRPFCAKSPNDYLLVRGPVTFHQEVVVTARGEVTSEVDIGGQLEIRSVGPNVPPDDHRANVSETQTSRVTDQGGFLSGLLRQIEVPFNQSGHGALSVKVSLGPDRAPKYQRSLECAP